MHYTIERTRKDEPFGDILDSNRRAGNEAGKAQAFALARTLGRKYPDSTIFVNEVISRDDENVIAAINANADVKEKYPKIEYLEDTKKRQRLIKLFLEVIQEEIKRGVPADDAKATIINLLTEARPT